MCGIVGYIGKKDAKNVIYSGLKQLEYRGYDSAGVLVVEKGKIHLDKEVGTVNKVDIDSLPGSSGLGIGHTRWATHGGVTKDNAHPHTYGGVSLVHNGIIENYEDLKDTYELQPVSETDSEVLAGVIDYKMVKEKFSLREATARALSECQGTYGVLAVAPKKEPGTLVAARSGSPIVIGVGSNKEYIVASDPSAILSTNKMVFLADGEIAEFTDGGMQVYDFASKRKDIKQETVEAERSTDDLKGFDTYLHKEIFEQPDTLKETMRGRISSEGKFKLGGPSLNEEQIQNLKSIFIIGCGTAFYAGQSVKYALEELLNIPVVVEYASEFRYRHAALEADNSVAIFMSQSGETADTLAAESEAQRRGMPTMGIVNSVGSTLARNVSHGGIYLHAGIEKSVASTKAYSSMVVALLMFGGYLAERRGLPLSDIRQLGTDLLDAPREIASMLESFDDIMTVAGEVSGFSSCFVLGRDTLYPVALEGALKITEVSYIHAQALPTGEMKHGPIALIDENHLSIVLMPEDKLMYEKTCSGIQEIRARNGKVLTIGSRPAKGGLSDWHIATPMTGKNISGLVINCALQQLAYGIAKALDRNIDRPRNLAKSVTVE
jgi:glucosamine--fructose-6-phosphate aminotransferase (isomerizing)